MNVGVGGTVRTDSGFTARVEEIDTTSRLRLVNLDANGNPNLGLGWWEPDPSRITILTTGEVR